MELLWFCLGTAMIVGYVILDGSTSARAPCSFLWPSLKTKRLRFYVPSARCGTVTRSGLWQPEVCCLLHSQLSTPLPSADFISRS